MFSCSKIEQKQLNTWVSFQSAEQPLLGQFSVSGNTQGRIWRKARDGRIFINIEEVDKWVESAPQEVA